MTAYQLTSNDVADFMQLQRRQTQAVELIAEQLPTLTRAVMTLASATLLAHHKQSPSGEDAAIAIVELDSMVATELQKVSGT